jgi:uncharacterized protein involved in exopolysaccharide biosynthesis
VTAPAPPSRGFDPEAEQDVDFAGYARMLAVRWWLLAAGVVAGAVIGYLVSLGGNQVYSATASLYLGQPYTPTGNSLLQSPLVQISVQARKAKVAECAANGLADAAVTKLGGFARGKISSFNSEIATDVQYIKTLQTAIASPAVTVTDKLILQTQLRSYQQDKITATLLLQQAQQIEAPRKLVGAAARKVTARSRRNTVVVAAVIGLILGALAALLWDSVVPRLTPRNGTA